MTTFTYILITVAAICGMEFVAWFTHKYVMHGLLWSWHEDHHKPHFKEGKFFEKNDLFFLVFATPGAGAILAGSFTSHTWLFFVGLGITIYGAIYFLIHDVYIHQRFEWFRQLDNKYSRAILRAHGAHHARQTKEDCESFGLLVVNQKFFKKRSQWEKKVA
ncbi:MAG: sterol desaturase family protein [Lewinellaceae bacterium]|nr:sterol desaturase family protein [Saprospiraceae bacterium]MCB9337485.1 sterol desaturase family protein [Lewinellaceae bacterium]